MRVRVTICGTWWLEPPLAEGEAVVVDRVHGLTLSVRRAEVWEVEP